MHTATHAQKHSFTYAHTVSSHCGPHLSRLRARKGEHHSTAEHIVHFFPFSFQRPRRGVRSAPRTEMPHMRRSAAHTPSWKNDERVQSVLFSRGAGDIFPAWNPSHCHNKEPSTNKNVRPGFKASLVFFFLFTVGTVTLGQSHLYIQNSSKTAEVE